MTSRMGRAFSSWRRAASLMAVSGGQVAPTVTDVFPV